MIPAAAIGPLMLAFLLTGFLVGVFIGARYFDLVAPNEGDK